MDLVEFVMCQPHIAEKIFANLNFQELISFSKASSSCRRSTSGYLRRLKFMKIIFSKFCEPRRERVNSFLAGNTDLRHLSVVIDGSQDKVAMSTLCRFIRNNSNLQRLQLKTYHDLDEQILDDVSSLRSLTSLHLVDCSLCDPEPGPALRFYANLQKNCPHLKELRVKEHVTDECLKIVSEMKLQSLDLLDCSLDDMELRRFVLENPQIERLDLTNTTVSGGCLKLLPENCCFLRHLRVTDPEDLDDVTVVADIMAGCPRLGALKFHCEEENLFLDFDVGEGKLKFNFAECCEKIEKIFRAFRPLLSRLETIRLSGTDVSGEMVRDVTARCRELRQVNVINASLVVRNAVIFDDAVLSCDDVIQLVKNNAKLEHIDLGFKEWSIGLCRLLCQANSNIATVKVRSLYEMGEECKILMSESFINKSRNPLVYLGRRIK